MAITEESANYKQTGSLDTFEKYDQRLNVMNLLAFNLKKVPLVAKIKGNPSTIQRNYPSLFLQYIG